jgi:hypothetical protein
MPTYRKFVKGSAKEIQTHWSKRCGLHTVILNASVLVLLFFLVVVSFIIFVFTG